MKKALTIAIMLILTIAMTACGDEENEGIETGKTEKTSGCWNYKVIEGYIVDVTDENLNICKASINRNGEVEEDSGIYLEYSIEEKSKEEIDNLSSNIVEGKMGECTETAIPVSEGKMSVTINKAFQDCNRNVGCLTLHVLFEKNGHYGYFREDLIDVDFDKNIKKDEELAMKAAKEIMESINIK